MKVASCAIALVTVLGLFAGMVRGNTSGMASDLNHGRGWRVVECPLGVVSTDKDLTSVSVDIEIALGGAEFGSFRVNPSDYDVPLLDISSLRRGTDTLLNAVFSSGYEDSYASVVIHPTKKGVTQIKVRLNNIKPPQEGSQYYLWGVSPESSYTLLGRIELGKKKEGKVEAKTTASNLGLFITMESHGSNAASPVGGLVAAVVR